jgi:hypothetical protein
MGESSKIPTKASEPKRERTIAQARKAEPDQVLNSKGKKPF